MSTLSLRLPNSLHKAVKQLAVQEHISLNQFIALAIAEKLSTLITIDYLKTRGKRANKKNFIRILGQVPDKEPADFDKL
jgi:predicted transcriptional regulator